MEETPMEEVPYFNDASEACLYLSKLMIRALKANLKLQERVEAIENHLRENHAPTKEDKNVD